MKRIFPPLILSLILMLVFGCTTQKKLAYLNNIPETGEQKFYPMNVPDYRIATRDVIYVSAKGLDGEGKMIEFLRVSTSGGGQQDPAGYVVNSEGNIILPVVGPLRVTGMTIDEVRKLVQEEVVKVFKNSTVECRLINFKYTIIGEVNSAGTFYNSSEYMTVFEAIGQAGGISDFGNRSNLFIIRTVDNETKTLRINLQDKAILSSDEYYIRPNDVVVIQPRGLKIFNLNAPYYTFWISTISSTITLWLLIISLSGNN